MSELVRLYQYRTLLSRRQSVAGNVFVAKLKISSQTLPSGGGGTRQWRSWTLPEWNAALVSAVFLQPGRGKTLLSRIDATPRLLRKCTGDAECKAEEARRRFVSAFGNSSSEIMRHFVWLPTIATQTRQLGMPAGFAALYLTLLAASADEATYDEGDFRRRFAALVRPAELSSPPSFADLPALWEHVRSWSRARAERSGDCSILVLPDPKHETRIGYSKRLAFPTYRDEIQLHRALQERGLSSNSDFAAVLKAIYARLNNFSEGFTQEVGEFSSLVSGENFRDAYESPLWGAVKDITWEETLEERRTKGRFCLQLDVSDPLEPALYLLVDDAARKAFGGSGWRELAGSAEFRHLWLPKEGARITLSALGSLFQQRQLGSSKIGRALQNGCLAFLPDAIGNLTTQGEYSDDGQITLLAGEGLAADLVADAKLYGVHCERIQCPEVLQTSELLVFRSVSRASLLRLAQRLPEGVLDLGWKPPRPSLAGGAWFGQTLLLNPASNPFVRMPFAKRGTYSVLGVSGEILLAGDLVACEEGFYIPPKQLAGLLKASKIVFCLEGGDENPGATLEVPLITNAPFGKVMPLADRAAWLVDGEEGFLTPLPSSGQGHRNGAPPSAGATAAPRGLGFEACDQQEWATTELADVEHLPAVMDWLCEALSLRYQSRATLPFSDLKRHVSMACEASGLPAWKLMKLLVTSSWISGVEKRTAPYTLFIPGERTISYETHGEMIVARIVGMFSRAERARLRSGLENGEAVFRVQANDLQSTGCIELHLESEERVKRIADELELTLVRRDIFPSLFAALRRQPAWVKSLGGELRGRRDLSVWNAEKLRWEDCGPDPETKAGTLVRYQGAQRFTFWVFGAGCHWKTDSVVWAWLWRAAIDGKPVGFLARSGDCKFARQVIALPQILSRWWMHWGGGCIASSEEGDLLLVGGCDTRLWQISACRTPSSPVMGIEGSDRAMQRRKLALRLRARAQIRASNSG